MRHCPNDACPDAVEQRRRGEYLDHVHACPRCGHDLVEGAAPALEPTGHVCVMTFTGPAEAHLAQAKLEANGIPAVLQDEHVVSINWLASNAVGGVKVAVPAEYADEALDLLAEDDAELLDTIPESRLPPAPDETCPRCGAVVVDETHLDVRSRAISMLVGFPFSLWRRSVQCGACGYRWRAGKSRAAG